MKISKQLVCSLVISLIISSNIIINYKFYKKIKQLDNEITKISSNQDVQNERFIKTSIEILEFIDIHTKYIKENREAINILRSRNGY